MTAYTFDQIIDYTRTSAATYVANTGFVTQTPASRNLLTFTQEFDNAAWTKTNSQIVPNVNPAAASLGAELVTNGTFDSGTTGWSAINATHAVVGGQLEVTQTAANARSEVSFTTTVGRTYLVTAQARVGTASSAAVTAREGSGAFNQLNTASTSSATLTSLSFYFTATTASSIIQLVVPNTAGVTCYFDNISVREVIGGLITAPDGTLTGDALVEDTINSRHSLSQTATIAASATHTVSVYVKAGTGRYFTLSVSRAAAGSVYYAARYDLQTATVTATGTGGGGGTHTASSITAVGNGWYRCVLTGTLSTFTDAVVMASGAINPTGFGDRGAEVYIGTNSTWLLWGAQFEQASAASTYTRNVGGLYPPRFDYDPVTLAPRGLLIEEQRTNLFTNSEFPNGLSDAPTRGGNVSISAFSLLPGNTGLAINNTGAVTSFAYKTNFTTVVSTTYTLSAFVRMDDGGAPSFGSTVTTASQNSFVLVVAGSAINPTTYTVTAMGNGFYRVSVVSTAGSASVNNGVLKYDTNDGRSFTVSGYQLEVGAFATSYIPTVASQVTRTADVATVTGANFSRWFNGTEGTFVAEFDCSGSSSVLSADDTTNNNFIRVGRISATGRLRVFNGGVDQADVLPANAPGWAGVVKIAAAYKANDFAASASGGAASTDTSGTIPTVTQFRLGTAGSGDPINGHIRRIRYYPTRLSNTQLQALTA